MSLLYENLKILRINEKLTQNDLADYLGITRSAYGNYENNIREPEIKALVKLADFYNVSLDDLVGRQQNPNNTLLDAIRKKNFESNIETIVQKRLKELEPNIIKAVLDGIETESNSNE